MPIYPDKKAGKLTGWWRVEVQIGKRRLRGRFRTHDEAQAKEKEFKEALSKPEPDVGIKRVEDGSRPESFSELVKLLVPTLWRDSDDLPIIKARLKEMETVLGDFPLTKLEVSKMDALVTYLRDQKGLKPSTVNKYLSHLNRVLKAAKTRRWLSELPDLTDVWQDEDSGRIRWITEKEERVMLDLFRFYGAPWMASLVYAAIRTGMRAGELLTLEEDQLREGVVVLWADKTKTRTERMVPLVDRRVEEALREVIAKRPTYRMVRHLWDKAKAEMGLEEDAFFTFHATRHTAATRLVRARVNLRVVQRFMGHKAIETTLRYAHVDDDLLQEAARALAGRGLVPYSSIPVTPSGGGLTVGDGWGKPQEIRPSTTGAKCAGVAELVDALDLGSSDPS